MNEIAIAVEWIIRFNLRDAFPFDDVVCNLMLGRQSDLLEGAVTFTSLDSFECLISTVFSFHRRRHLQKKEAGAVLGQASGNGSGMSEILDINQF
jgi:hypothetical protein